MPFRITDDCLGCGQCVQWCPTKAIKGHRRVSYRIDSARCIDCGVCGKICNFAAVINPDGSTAKRIRRLQWDRPHWDYQSCIQCDLCLPACPVKCIQISVSGGQELSAPFGYPYVTRPRMCIGCGFCARACPVDSILMKPLEIPAKTSTSTIIQQS